MADTPLQSYRDLVHRGVLAPDPAQELAAKKLQLLASRLGGLAQPARGALLAPFLRKRREAPQGLYLFGRVGRGKTMLMDLFFASVAMRDKRSVHFQEFMSEAHELIDRARKSDAADPVKQAAPGIAAEASTSSK